MPIGPSFVATLVASAVAVAQCGTQWLPGPPPAHFVSDAVAAPGGVLFMAAQFAPTSPLAGNRVVRWDGVALQSVGSTFDGVVTCIARAPNGELFAGGDFLHVGNTAVTHVARWDGTAWSPLGFGVGLGVSALAALPNGDLIAAGSFPWAGSWLTPGIARWDGLAWSPMGAGISGEVRTLLVDGDGDLLIGGSLGQALFGSGVARWDGVAWSTVGAMVGIVNAVVELPNGDLLAGGRMNVGSVDDSIVRWNGVAWQPFAPALIRAGLTAAASGLLRLDNGDLIAAGIYTQAGPVAAHGVARWDGASWSPLATTGVGWVQKLLRQENGDVLGIGAQTLDGVACGGLARLTTTCPATATTSGVGCGGAGGQDVLTPQTLPWIGGSTSAVATGLAASGFAVDVTGFSAPAVPLPTILPQALPGCSLLASPDLVRIVAFAGGAVAVSLAIPEDLSLVGVTLHEQVVSFDLTVPGIASVTSTNRVTFTIGDF
jgi:trimeric autotransporter adhesin